MFQPTKLTILALALSLPVIGHCADGVERVRVESTPYYLDAAAAKGDADVTSFKLYTSGDASDQGTEYKLNCSSREFSTLAGGEWSPPMRILAGESLYHVGKKLCDWDGKGLMQKYFY